MTIGLSNLNSLFSKYGVSSSGDIQTALIELKKAMQAKGESTSAIDGFASMISQVGKFKKPEGADSTEKTRQQNDTKSYEKPQGGPPWASLMQSLGLELQGSPEADFAAMSEKISEMSASATTPEQQANIASLQSQLEQYQAMAPQGAGGSGISGMGNLQNFMTKRLANNKEGLSEQKGDLGFSLPWSSLLETVGIEPQGSPQADFAAIAQKLEQMKTSDTTGSQQSTIASLQAKLAQYKNQTQAMVVRG